MPDKANKFLYKLKRNELTFADMKFMSLMRSGGITDAEAIDWLDRVVEGGVMNIPLPEFNEVFSQIYKQFYDIDDPEDNSGKA